MELSEELLELKNTEIRVLTEKLHEKDELIRTITINYETYLNDYESRWGRYINDYDYVARELYYAKKAYYNILEQNYEHNKQKDKETEEKLKALREELAVLKDQLDNSVSNEEIFNRVLLQPLSDQKKYTQQLQWLLRGTNYDKIDLKLINKVTASIKRYEEEQMRKAYGNDYQDSPLLSYIVDSSKVGPIIELLKQKVVATGHNDAQAFPIRAAMNAGVITRIPWSDFHKSFPHITISKTRYNAIVNTENEDKAVLNHKKEINQLENLFRDI